ncbi:MAG: hypothetical protein FWF91_08555, partial [Coriobacteriia bacterium]|nr:hypothetical protein [Coriobacteriia bacterium]
LAGGATTGKKASSMAVAINTDKNLFILLISVLLTQIIVKRDSNMLTHTKCPLGADQAALPCR